MARIPVEVLINAKDNASAVFKRFSGNADKTTKSLATSLNDAAIGSAALGASLLSAASFAVVTAANFEQNTIALQTMLGSVEEGNKLMRRLTDFAKSTPFELQGLQTATKQLLAYGSTQETVIDELRVLGDISAGVGRDKLPQLILAYGQVQAATKLTGAELRQFTEAGVPLLQGLADNFGVTTAAVQEMVSEGSVGFKDVQQVLGELTGEGGKFFQLMQKQSQTTSGQFSNLKDSVTLLAAEFGAKLLPAMNAIIDAFNTKLIPFVNTATEYFKQNKTALLLVAGALLGALVPAFYALATSIGAASLALAPFVAAGGALAMLAGLLDYISVRVTGFGLLDQLKSMVEIITPKVWDLVNAIQDLGNKLRDFSQSPSRFNVVGQFNSALDLLSQRQHGGETTIGKPYLVGERGPELFVPRQSGQVVPNDKVGGGQQIVFNVNVGMYAGSVNERRNIAETLFRDIATLAQGRGVTPAELLNT